jgi:hypothetical protein
VLIRTLPRVHQLRPVIGAWERFLGQRARGCRTALRHSPGQVF